MLMVHLEMLEGENEPLEPRAFVESVGHGAGNMASHNQAPVDGLWRPAVRVWDRVAEGAVLGTVNDLHGGTKAEIRAGQSGLVIALPRMQYVPEGTQCGIVV